MASVYKRGKDKRKKRACWYFQFKDEYGKYRTRKGFSDKTLTTQLANKLEVEAKQRAMGLIDPELERQAIHRNSPIVKHVEAFRIHQTNKNSKTHADLLCNRILRVVKHPPTSSLLQSTEADFEFTSEVRENFVETFSEFFKRGVSVDWHPAIFDLLPENFDQV